MSISKRTATLDAAPRSSSRAAALLAESEEHLTHPNVAAFLKEKGTAPREFFIGGWSLGGNFTVLDETGHMVRISGGDLSYDSIDYNSIFAIGMMLFLMTMMLNLISRWIVRRFREEY